MKPSMRLVALGATFLVSFLLATFLLTLHPVRESEGYCDTVASILVYGQGGYGDTLPSSVMADDCRERALLPGVVGLAIALVGLAAGLMWIVVFRRGRSLRPSGEPISRAIRRPEEPRRRPRRAP